MNIFKKAKKNRDKFRRAYNRGYNDSQKHWHKQINSQKRIFENEIDLIKRNAETQIKLIKEAYDERESHFDSIKKGLANAAKFWLTEADKLNEINSETIGFMSEFDETIDSILRQMGHIKRLKSKSLHAAEKLNDHMYKAIKNQPRVLQ